MLGAAAPTSMCFLKLKFSSKQSTKGEHKSAQKQLDTHLSKQNRKRSGSQASTTHTSSSSLSSGQQSFVSTSSGGSKSEVGVGAKQLASHGAMVFRLKELKRATDQFSSARKVGDSRSVYRASLEGKEVTITEKDYEGGDMDFLAELKIVSSVHHANIVKLLGGCFVAGDRVYLVHEFAEGVNLRHALRSPNNPRFTLLPSWTSRLTVALDVAKALEYLHEYAYPTYIHKFIKSSNIIIDSDLRAKVAQFGVSRLTGDLESPIADTSISRSRASGDPSMSSGEIHHESGDSSSSSFSGTRGPKQRSIRIKGTRGYMPPEYLSSGLVSVNYDVYAFGVVLLELLSGQEPIGFIQGGESNVYRRISITETITSILEGEAARMKLRKWMDPLLQDAYPLDSAHKTALLAKACVDPNPGFRPLMRDVALQLSKLLGSATVWEASMAAAKGLMSGPVEAR